MRKLLAKTLLISAILAASPTSAHALSIDSICEMKGQRVSVTVVTTEGETVTWRGIVGDPNDGCPGRCGKGCGWGIRDIYTRECLEHDACEHVKHNSFGPCADLMKRAVASYLAGPSCR